MMDKKQRAARLESRMSRIKARKDAVVVMLERAKTRRIERAERAKQKGKGKGPKNDRP